jgi:hypothetical protein
MKITVDFSALDKITKKLYSGDVDFSAESYYKFEPLDFELAKGIELDINQITVEHNLLTLNGRQILLYIKDHSGKLDDTVHNPEAGNRFHVSHCEALERMKLSNRYQRYVATNQLSGVFNITDDSGVSSSSSAECQLMACKYCLKKVNYKNVRDYQAVPRDIWHGFSIVNFFSLYSSCFLYMPQAWAENQKYGYSDDWKLVSERTRSAANYICKDCGVDLSKHKSLCHVHHVNGVKSDNSPANLEVLCIDCHRRKPLHQGMFVRHKDMQAITSLRRSSNMLVAVDGWDDVWSLCDPAVHGDLGILKSRGFKPPVIGFELTNDRYEVIAELEAAWPEQKKAIVIDKVNVPGWQLFQVGDVCAGRFNV